MTGVQTCALPISISPLLPFSHFWRIHANLSFTTLCIGCVSSNFDCKFLYYLVVLFPRSEDQKHSFLGMESAKIEKITQKNVFFQKIFGQFKKKQYLCTRFREESKSSVK